MAFFLFALAYVGFLDELSSGVPIVSAPQIRASFALDFAAVSFVLLALPGVSALLVEAPLLLLSERWGRRFMVRVSLWTMAACTVLVALASEVWLLSLAFVLWSPANGVGTGLSEAALMDARPARREQMMTRWTLMGTLGDMAAPGLLALLAWVGADWRAGMLAVATLLLVHGWLLGRRCWPEQPTASRREIAGERGKPGPGQDADSEAGRAEPLTALFVRVREGSQKPELWWWMLGVLLCGLLDEVLVAFGTLYLHERFQASLLEQTSAFLGFSLGSAFGLLLSERMLGRLGARRVLTLASLGSALVFLGWLNTTSLQANMALLALTGVFTAPLFPIASAQAYRAVPDRSTTVAALMQLTAPVELFLPLVIGWIADGAGLTWALSLLALQPLGMLAVVWATRKRGPFAG